MTATRCRECKRPMRRPSPDGYGPVCRTRLRPRQPALPRLDLPPPVPAATGQLALPAAVPCGEWPAPVHRPTVTVPGPDTWPTAEET